MNFACRNYLAPISIITFSFSKYLYSFCIPHHISKPQIYLLFFIFYLVVFVLSLKKIKLADYILGTTIFLYGIMILIPMIIIPKTIIYNELNFIIFGLGLYFIFGGFGILIQAYKKE